MVENLGDVLTEACTRFGSSVAVRDAGAQLEYRELDSMAQRVADALRHCGMAPDEPVLVPVANEARDLAAFMGVWRGGGVVVPIARDAPTPVVESMRASTRARLVATNAENPVEQAGVEPPKPRAILAGAAIIVFTSGSTGIPKGVVLSHRAFTRKLAAIDEVLAFSLQTRVLLVLKITFVFGVWVALLTLRNGGHLTMHGRFDALRTLEVLGKERITDAALVPTMLRKLLSVEPAAARATLARTRKQRILTGGEPFHRELWVRLKESMSGLKVVDIYGSTETCSSDFFHTEEVRGRFSGSLGRACKGVRFRIADEHGREVRAGEVGELQIDTPFAMNGYLDAPDLTRDSFVHGFFRTGDLARVRDDGAVELAGRAKDLIVRGGAKVSPLELDGIIAQHPSVAAALTVGVPDAVMGERIHVLVVPRADVHVSEAELREWVADRIERFKRPDVFHFGDELPTSSNGKVDREALRRQIIALRA